MKSYSLCSIRHVESFDNFIKYNSQKMLDNWEGFKPYCESKKNFSIPQGDEAYYSKASQRFY